MDVQAARSSQSGLYVRFNGSLVVPPMKVELPGAGQHWGVDALEDGGALVHRWKAGSNQASSAIYTHPG
jgi:hypothetical protein